MTESKQMSHSPNPIVSRRVDAADWDGVITYADSEHAIATPMGVHEVISSPRFCRECQITYAGVVTTADNKVYFFNLFPDRVVEKLMDQLHSMGAEKVVSVIVGGNNVARKPGFTHPFRTLEAADISVDILDPESQDPTTFSCVYEPKERGFIYCMTPSRRIHQRSSTAWQQPPWPYRVTS